MDYKQLIINKSALKRIFYIYLPVAAVLWALMMVAGHMMDKPSPPLDLAVPSDRLPVVYSENYNIGFFGLEELHPFDTAKYRKIMKRLLDAKALTAEQVLQPARAPDDILLLAHSAEYLESLHSSATIARIMEVNALKFMPSRLSRPLVVDPQKWQAGGSLLAAAAALKHGWAVNLGGGFHHASKNDGQGFCAIADISLVINYLRQEGLAKKVMIIDLDAHQGNGHGTDYLSDPDVFIVDLYNKDVYPHDEAARKGIDLEGQLEIGVEDKEYLQKVGAALDFAFNVFKPEIVIYNAGTDILAGDPLGGMEITSDGVIRRDEMVFAKALDKKVPIVMLLSGGYQKNNADVIADSILNLKAKFKLF